MEDIVSESDIEINFSEYDNYESITILSTYESKNKTVSVESKNSLSVNDENYIEGDLEVFVSIV